MPGNWSETETCFVERAVRRKALFWRLSVIGVVVATALAGYYGYRLWRDGAESLGLHVALVVLILLNARQNLRQHRYARVLERVLERTGGQGESGGRG